jgi:hypothetical protein
METEYDDLSMNRWRRENLLVLRRIGEQIWGKI